MKLKKNLSSKWVKRLRDFYFVGCYVGEELILHDDYEEQGSVLKIKCLSPMPEKLIAYLESYSFIFSCDVFQADNEKYFKRWIGSKEELSMDGIKSFLSNKHILFQLYCDKGQLFVQVVDNISCYQEEYYFIVPSPLLRVKLTKEDLEYRLEKGYLPIQFMDYNNEFPPPPVLYYEGTLYGNIRLKSTVNPYTYVSLMNSVLWLNVENDWRNIVSFHVQRLYFLRSSVYNKIVRELITTGERLNVENKDETRFLQEETEFLLNLQNNLMAERIFIDWRDTINFHTSVKTNAVTILSGPPGVGKSNLARIYGEALGLRMGNELLLVPISPSYGEPMDILGYLHPESNVYIESETGIVSLLKEAEKNKDSLYMIVFEEMNLSQVEFWFAPFLSILEQRCDCRHIRLFSDDDENGIIEIGDNVLFVGTINMDDTTKPLSPRFLDRVNLVTLQPLSFKELLNKMNSTSPEDRKIMNTLSYTQYKHEWINETNGFSELTEQEVTYLDCINELFRKYIGQDGLSLRSAERLIQYIKNIPLTDEGLPYFTRQEGIDIQMKQRVFSKLYLLKQEAGMLGVIPFLDELIDVTGDEQFKEVSTFFHSITFLKELKSILEKL